MVDLVVVPVVSFVDEVESGLLLLLRLLLVRLVVRQPLTWWVMGTSNDDGPQRVRVAVGTKTGST